VGNNKGLIKCYHKICSYHNTSEEMVCPTRKQSSKPFLQLCKGNVHKCLKCQMWKKHLALKSRVSAHEIRQKEAASKLRLQLEELKSRSEGSHVQLDLIQRQHLAEKRNITCNSEDQLMIGTTEESSRKTCENYSLSIKEPCSYCSQSSSQHQQYKQSLPTDGDNKSTAKRRTKCGGLRRQQGMVSLVPVKKNKLKEKRFLCEMCGKMFINCNCLNKHMFKKHNTESNTLKTDVENCYFKSHSKTHAVTKKRSMCVFVCRTKGCNKAFTNEKSYRVHTRCHMGLQLYVCTVRGCGRDFSQWETYRNHTLIHSISNNPGVLLYNDKL